MLYEDTQEMRCWICPNCLETMRQYEHVFEWSESFKPLSFSEYYNGEEGVDLAVTMEDEDGYDGFGLCIGCQEVSAQLGTGWFIEKCIVDVGFSDDRVYYRTLVQR